MYQDLQSHLAYWNHLGLDEKMPLNAIAGDLVHNILVLRARCKTRFEQACSRLFNARTLGIHGNIVDKILQSDQDHTTILGWLQRP